jgi:Uma2 family endonuclease
LIKVLPGEHLMPTVIADGVSLTIPEWVTNLAAFRRWTDDVDFPQTGNIWWLRGRVWADLSKEPTQAHARVKGELLQVLGKLDAETDLGELLQGGARLENADAGISGKPDALFISYETLKAGHAILVEREDGSHTLIEGSPDMVLEVVSDSSEQKDCFILRADYFQAGVKEYWLVDAREDPIQFDILRRNAKGFAVSRKQAGWTKSSVFGKSFKFEPTPGRRGNSNYRLEMK